MARKSNGKPRPRGEHGERKPPRGHPPATERRWANPEVRPDLALLDARLGPRDDRGFPKRVALDVPPHFHAEVLRWLDDVGDWDDLSSFIRTAMLFTMDYRERLDPSDRPNNIAILKAIAEQDTMMESRLQFINSIEKRRNTVYELIARGLQKTAAEHVRKFLEAIRELPEGDEYRALCEVEVKKAFGHLLKGGKISSLAVDEDEG